MGAINQLIFLNSFKNDPKSVLEVGSKNYGNTQPFREMFPGVDYVGVDLEDGDGVDVVWNLESGVGDLKPADLLICCSVMEHTPRPWILAETLQKLVKPGGSIYIAVPWVWRYHPYPDDYFRFSFSGIKSLFPQVTWEQMAYSTYRTGEFLKCKEGVDNALHVMDDGRKYLPYLEIHAFGKLNGP